MAGDPEDFDTALADYVHFRNELNEATGRLADAQRAARDAEIELRAAEQRHDQAREVLNRFVKRRA